LLEGSLNVLLEDPALVGGMSGSIMVFALCLIVTLFRGYRDMIGR
jgi:hypothetical protein